MKRNRTCIIYRINIQKRDFDREISNNKSDSRKSKKGYYIYDIFLYRKGNCVKRFHNKRDIMKLTK